jgi:hypothetical protein
VVEWCRAQWEFAIACDEPAAALDEETSSGERLRDLKLGASPEAATRQRVGQTVIGPLESRRRLLHDRAAAGELSAEQLRLEEERIEREVAEARKLGQEVSTAKRGRPLEAAAFLAHDLMHSLVLAGFGEKGGPSITTAITYAQGLAAFFYVDAQKRALLTGHGVKRELVLATNTLRAAATEHRRRKA